MAWQEGFHRAVIEGVPWKVLSKDVASQLPHLLSLVLRMSECHFAAVGPRA